MSSSCQNGKCIGTSLCFFCKIIFCNDCQIEHNEHSQYTVDKQAMIQQLVQSKSKYYTFTDKIVSDMKQTLTLASSLFAFDVNYINNMIKLFMDYEDQQPNRERLSKEIEQFLFSSYQLREWQNEILIENVNLKHFVDPIKESFQAISKNYLEFYKSMRNMELFKISISGVAQKKDKKKGTKNLKSNEKMEQIYSDLSKGLRIKDIQRKYNMCGKQISNYLQNIDVNYLKMLKQYFLTKIAQRNDEDMKNFRYSKEYNQLRDLFNEDDPAYLQMQKETQKQNIAQENNLNKKKKGRPSKQFILESLMKNKSLAQKDTDLIQDSSETVKLNKKEQKIDQKQQDKFSLFTLSNVSSCIAQQPESKAQNSIANSATFNCHNSGDLSANQSENQIQSLFSERNNCAWLDSLTQMQQSQTNNPLNQNQKSTAEQQFLSECLNHQNGNSQLKLREQSDQSCQSHHMIPASFKKQPCIGITSKNELHFYSIDGKNIQLNAFKIENSKIYQENFIKSVNILQSQIMNRDIIFLQSMNNSVFTIDSATFQIKKTLSGVECFDCLSSGINEVILVVKSGLNIVRYVYAVDKKNEMGSFLKEKRVICQVNPVKFLELNKIISFIYNAVRYLAFQCKNGVYIYKQDEEDLKYDQVLFINEPGVVFARSNPKSVFNYQFDDYSYKQQYYFFNQKYPNI